MKFKKGDRVIIRRTRIKGVVTDINISMQWVRVKTKTTSTTRKGYYYNPKDLRKINA